MALPNHLVGHFVETAELLKDQAGRDNLGKAMRRRAISSAYYAVFHALCCVVADCLIGWSSEAVLLDPVFRSVDHKTAKQRLLGSEDPALKRIGLIFGRLQEKRNRADYAPPAHNPSVAETMDAIEQARDAIRLIEALSHSQRRTFAVAMISKTR